MSGIVIETGAVGSLRLVDNSNVLTNPSLVMGLRFRKSQARMLRNLTDQLKERDLPGVDISLFEKAAQAAAAGEPLLVHCESREEVELMAAAFAQLGVARPQIDELAGR